MKLPIDLKAWIEQNRDSLKPPVGNKLVWPSDDYIIMAVGGPNAREDYHVNQGEEFFFQIEGDMTLKVIDQGQPKDIPIKQGETFLLPANTPHSPQRPANTVGIVIEKVRQTEEIDGFQWYCQQCGEKIYEEFVHVHDIVGQLPEIFDHFYDNPENTTCKQCGWVAKRSD